MNYKIPTYAVAGGLIIATASGCATRGTVRNLATEVEQLKGQFQQNSGRIQDLALTPKSEICAYVSKAKHQKDFVDLRGKIIPMYKDSGSKRTAEELADLLRVDALGGRDAYNASVLQDVNKDGIATKGVDYWIVDYRKNAQGVEETVRLFRVPREMIPESVRNRLHEGCKIN